MAGQMLAEIVAEPRSAPAPGQMVELDAGLFWLRFPLPFALDHVNLWVLDDGDGWTLIDTGYGDEPSRGLWEGLLAGPLAGRPLRRLLVTHFHPDHLGLAGWLAERHDVELLMTRTEWLTGRMLALDDSETFLAAGDRHWRAAGMPEEAVATARQRGNTYRRGVTVPPARMTRVMDGQTLRLGGGDWRVIVGRGHAPELITLWSQERGILLAGDQILPRISPVVGIWASTPEADPLGEFLDSLDHYRGLPEDCRVLPSHRQPFRGLAPRLDELRRHHEERLDRALAACAGPVTAADVMPHLFDRPLDVHQQGFALAETYAHLAHLVARGQVAQALDDAGVWRYRTS